MRRLFVFAISILLLIACSAREIKPGAQKVRITTKEPSSSCEYLGEVTGSQGGSFTGKFTSNEDLETGARNDLKNKAAAMGGNVVHLLANRAGETGKMTVVPVGKHHTVVGGGSTRQTNVTYSGAVYRCKNYKTSGESED
jgi:hypothetical protein